MPARAWTARACAKACASSMAAAAACGGCTCCRTAISWPGTGWWPRCRRARSTTAMAASASACGDAWPATSVASAGGCARCACMRPTMAAPWPPACRPCPRWVPPPRAASLAWKAPKASWQSTTAAAPTPHGDRHRGYPATCR
ncbi:hypothetical protein G6F24_013588 [Rhizopus arrhizus]|nr:hypothetical protein G6F24_013588 [Rhizopus arrhizus]